MSKLHLNTSQHDRDVVGMRYVYPVVSRRAGGVSLGINLNPNNACNWHCAYCQVPDLLRGVAPDIDVAVLRDELHRMLLDIVQGDFMQQRVPEDCRKLCDVAISGNGEPTSCAQFDVVVRLIIDVMDAFALQLPLRLITNASYAHKAHVQRGLGLMAAAGGEAWVKVDSVTESGIARLNGVQLTPSRLRQQLESVASVCPSWIQTCMLRWDGQPPSRQEVDAYIRFLRTLLRDGVVLRGVLLYGLARPSLQPQAVHVSALDAAWMQALAERIRQLGMDVRLSL